MTGCFSQHKAKTDIEKVPEVSTEGLEGGVDIITNYYLDEALKKMNVDVPVQDGKRSNKDMMEVKYNLLMENVQNAKRASKRSGDEAQAILEEMSDGIEKSIDESEVTMTTEDGTEYNFTGSEVVAVNGVNISKEQALNVIEEPSVQSSGKRGFYYTGISNLIFRPWFLGQIPYMFDKSISGENKEKVRAGMKESETKTGGKVKFIEVPYSDALNIVYYLPTALVTRFSSPGFDFTPNHRLLKIDGGAENANATIGCMTVGYNKLNFDNESFDEHETILHELGHIMGLLHEHQRYDRNDYVIVNDDHPYVKDQRTDWMRLPKYLELVVDIKKTIRICGWKKTIHIKVVLWREQSSQTEGPYDFLSIMHYYTGEKDGYGYDMVTRIGNNPIPENLVISSLDIEAVRKYYK